MSARFALVTQPKLLLAIATSLLAPLFMAAQVKPTPAADRMKAIEQRKLLSEKSMLKDAKFHSIGPSIMSGRVTDIDANPDDPTEFYVAYASGGVWYTTNNGQSFVPIFDSTEVLTIGDIAINWSAKPRIIWVGTGEVNSSRSSYAGTGVFKSIDNGKTWDYVGLPESQHIGKIQLHPTDKNTAWVAVLGHLYTPNKERGLYKTTDGGKTWKQTLYVDDNTGVEDIDINPSNPNELYAAAWYRVRSAWNFEEGGKSSGIYKSTDGGDTWKLLTTTGSGFPNGEGVGRIGVAVYPKNPQIVYAVVDNNFHKPDTSNRKKDTSRYVLRDFEKLTKEDFEKLDNTKLESFLRQNRFPVKYKAESVKDLVKSGKVKSTSVYDYLFDANTALFDTPIFGCQVYRSEDGGQTWKKANEKDISIYNTYGYYFGKIYVSPTNENKVYILGFTAQLSTDGGKSFKNMDRGLVHADHHALWVDPKRDSHFINGNDGGINITYDDGANWFKANTPPVGQFYSVVVDDAKPYNVYGGLQDNGCWVGPSNHREDPGWMSGGEYAFKNIGGGDGMQVQVDTRDNNTVYAGFQFGNYRRSLRIQKSQTDVLPTPGENGEEEDESTNEEQVLQAPDAADDGRPLNIHPQNELGATPLRFNWQTPILLSRHNQDILYYGTNKFYRSMNKGETMEVMSDDLTNGKKDGDVPYGTITTIAESPTKFGLLYVGTDDGNIHISTDGGTNWTLISKKLPQGLWVSRVIASKYKAGRVYATLNGYRYDHFLPYLFVSDDYGNNWKMIGKDLPFEPLNVVREDPKSDSILYVGSDGGLYVSVDAGTSFMMWDGGLPKSVPVHDIAIQERENEIVLGTHGRSLYIAKLDPVQQLLTDHEYRQKKQAESDKMMAVAKGTKYNDLYNRDGIEVACPTVNEGKTKKKGK